MQATNLSAKFDTKYIEKGWMVCPAFFVVLGVNQLAQAQMQTKILASDRIHAGGAVKANAPD
jgi:hypothetical protein